MRVCIYLAWWDILVNAGSNKHMDTSINKSKIAEETDIVKGTCRHHLQWKVCLRIGILVPTISAEVAKAIQKARTEKELSQKELAVVRLTMYDECTRACTGTLSRKLTKSPSWSTNMKLERGTQINLS